MKNTVKNVSKFNRSDIFKYTWLTFKAKNTPTMECFSECLKNAWHIAKTNPSLLKPYTINLDKSFRLYSKNILQFAMTKLNNYDKAQDILSNTFEKAILNKDKFDISKGTELHWLIRIANNCILDSYRIKKNRLTVNIYDYTDENGNEYFQIKSDNYTDKEIETTELSTDIYTALDKLSEKQQSIANLYFIEQKQYSDISKILNIPIGTVCITIKRIREKLQTTLSAKC